MFPLIAPIHFLFLPSKTLDTQKQQKFPLHGNSQPQKLTFLCGPLCNPHPFIFSLDPITFDCRFQMCSQILYEFIIRWLVQDRAGCESCNSDILMLLVVHYFSYYSCAGLPFWISLRSRSLLISFALCDTRWGKKKKNVTTSGICRALTVRLIYSRDSVGRWLIHAELLNTQHSLMRRVLFSWERWISKRTLLWSTL